jgi:uncharacterized protein (TIGR00725 family)
MKRHAASIAVIGDGTVDEGSELYARAESLGQELCDQGFRVVTGGLGGVMEAACRGARRSSAWRAGATIGVLPGHDPAAANPFVDIAVPTGLGHGRNLVIAHSEAVIGLGGGAGTLSELALAWIHGRLVIAFRGVGWSGRLAGTRIDEHVRFTGIPDDQVFGVNTPDEAVQIVMARLPFYQAALRGEP